MAAVKPDGVWAHTTAGAERCENLTVASLGRLLLKNVDDLWLRYRSWSSEVERYGKPKMKPQHCESKRMQTEQLSSGMRVIYKIWDNMMIQPIKMNNMRLRGVEPGTGSTYNTCKYNTSDNSDGICWYMLKATKTRKHWYEMRTNKKCWNHMRLRNRKGGTRHVCELQHETMSVPELSHVLTRKHKLNNITRKHWGDMRWIADVCGNQTWG